MARRTDEFRIAGTHCASCEVLLERRLRKIPGVTDAHVDHVSGTARIECDRRIPRTEIAAAVERDGYRLDDTAPRALAGRDYVEIGALVLAFLGVYLVARHFELVPDIGISNDMGLGLVFVIGLIAATSTCLAVTGGLLLALAAKYGEMHPELTGARKFTPTVVFTVGRVAGYTLFGAALGALGSLFAFSPSASGAVTVVAALVMIVLGLQMLRVIPALDRIAVRMPKWLAHRIYDRSGRTYRPWAPFVLGAGTFFVPCGFTQALQFYVLAKGSAVSGGLTMLAFSLGTVPMLLAIGAASSFTRGAVHRHFVRAAAVLVVLLGIMSLPAGLALLGFGG